MKKTTSKKKLSPSQKDARNIEILNAFHILSISNIELHDCIKKALHQFHSKELSDPKWNVLTIIYHMGPQTVPHIARTRQLSRQNIQNTVNLLLKNGYVEFQGNPAHKKSHLIGLTPKGKLLIDKTSLKEQEILKKIDIDIDPKDMLNASEVLQALKRFFESRQWKDTLKKANL